MATSYGRYMFNILRHAGYAEQLLLKEKLGQQFFWKDWRGSCLPSATLLVRLAPADGVPGVPPAEEETVAFVL